MSATDGRNKDSGRVPRRIGLALGSGAARGWAHIGVIEVLLERGHEITAVAGTSMGAFVGAFYAAGKLDIFADMARNLDLPQVLYHFLEVPFQRSGLLDGKKIATFMRRHIQVSEIKDLPVPFRAVATDLLTGAEVVIDSGDVIEAVRASMATPGIFTPVSKDGWILVDGALVNPVPVNVVRSMGADFVIAVDVSRLDSRTESVAEPRAQSEGRRKPARGSLSGDIAGKMLARIRNGVANSDRSESSSAQRVLRDKGMPNIIDVLCNSIRIIEAQMPDIRLKIDQPDLLVRPKVGHMAHMDFHHASDAIREGRRAMDAILQRGK